MPAFKHLISLITLCPTILLGQNSISIFPKYGEDKLRLDSAYITSYGDTVLVETLKFYITAVELLGDSGKQKNICNHHLVDLAVDSSLIISKSTNTATYKTIHFFLGIDSVTNTSGALGGDLDPSLGMYWTWQSGYINLKLEGTNTASAARNQAFQYHLGGYLPPYNALQKTILPVGSGKDIVISLDVKSLFESGSLKETSHIMSPSAKAVALSTQIASLFSVVK